MIGLPRSVVSDAAAWLADPASWSGRSGVLYLTGEHLSMTAIAVLGAAVVALPVGIWLGHTGRGGMLTVAVANTSRALPTLALLTLFASSAVGFGNPATVLAVTIFAIPPILSNAYEGVRGVDHDVREAAEGMGMNSSTLLREVSVPLAAPLIGAGLRTAAVQVVATIPIAALVGGGGLGVVIVSGIATQQYGKALGGAVLVAALSVGVEGLLALVQRRLTPAPVRLLSAAQAR